MLTLTLFIMNVKIMSMVLQGDEESIPFSIGGISIEGISDSMY